MKKTTQLRKALERSQPVLVVGAHDALSAKLIECAGFDAVWASGFGISASKKCLPDANYLTMTENLESAKNMNEAITIPVIADCDNGYGNALNVKRTVIEYEKAGIAAISIEDNVFPKQCSFYPGAKRELVSVEEMAGKIRAAQSTKSDPDFMIIARTEALIAGWGMDEALKRAHAYVDAGTDAVLIHSKSKSPDEILEFTKKWNKKVPLVVVPTIYDTISADDLYKGGCQIVIFANQPIRSAIHAIRKMLPKLKEAGHASVVLDEIVTLQDVYDLVGVSQMKEEEKAFLPETGQNVKAVIVAAGFDKQMMPLVENQPKAMLDIKGKSILERQIEILQQFGIRDISVVRGYKSEKINLPNINYYENEDFQESYILSSLFCAEQELDGRVIFLYGDILFEPSIIEKLLRSKEEVNLAVDRAWYDHFSKGEIPEGKERELVQLEGASKSGYRYMPGESDVKILNIGSKIDRNLAHAEFIGLAMFSEKGMARFKQFYTSLKASKNAHPFHEAPVFKKASFTDMIQEMIHQGDSITAIEIYKGWMEIDSFEDYKRAWAQID